MPVRGDLVTAAKACGAGAPVPMSTPHEGNNIFLLPSGSAPALQTSCRSFNPSPLPPRYSLRSLWLHLIDVHWFLVRSTSKILLLVPMISFMMAS